MAGLDPAIPLRGAEPCQTNRDHPDSRVARTGEDRWRGERVDVLMPQLGETVAEGKITKWFKSAGDAVKPGDNLFEIETDKVSMEVPSIATGTTAAIRVQ